MSELDLDIENLSKLAKLALRKEAIPKLTSDLENMLGMINRMRAVNVEGISPLPNPLEAHQRLRPDEVTEHDQRAALLSLSPEQEDGYFLVPKVIEP